ncbi:pyroglutamyl-peptidase I [Luteococcus sp. H138]|uniref:pyroglutamyl-peptidase I n=1 Tax=unclassified Luteococcus TaxID=2639923 RepID=UPI00313C44C3
MTEPTDRAMTILVTAFEPFGGEVVNPALEAVRGLPSTLAGARLVTVEVPTVFGRSLDVVREAIDRHWPDAVLCVGQAGGRASVTVERVAINVDDASIPDNAGAQPVDLPVVEGAPAAYLTTLPIKAMVHAIRDAGLPAAVSNTAGTFVCNHLMFGVLHHLATHGQRAGQARGGFIHVPYIPAQVMDRPELASMALDDTRRALEVAIEAIATHEVDITLAAGATH